MEITTFQYRITGPQTIDRLTPLLPKLSPHCHWNLITTPEVTSLSSNSSVVSFVWETYVERSFKRKHDQAIILNRLHNSVVSIYTFFLIDLWMLDASFRYDIVL